MQTVILFPTQAEAEGFSTAHPDTEVRICGVGMVRTAACVARLLHEGYRRFVLAGIAGSYGGRLPKGSVVAVAEERVAGLPAAYADSYRATWVPQGLETVTSNTVTSCGAEPDGADIENMEGAALFTLCAEFGADCCQIRAISNTVGENRSGWEAGKALAALHETLYKTICR